MVGQAEPGVQVCTYATNTLHSEQIKTASETTASRSSRTGTRQFEHGRATQSCTNPASSLLRGRQRQSFSTIVASSTARITISCCRSRLPPPSSACDHGCARPLPMSEITRESHYVPQATLRRWSEDGVNVHAYRLLVSHQDVAEWQPHALRGLTSSAISTRPSRATARATTSEVHHPRDRRARPGRNRKARRQRKMKPTDWHSIPRFVAAQQMRTPLFFIESVKRFNESMPETLQSILDEVGRKSPSRTRSGGA